MISGTLPGQGNTFKVCRFDASYYETAIYTDTGLLVWRTEPLEASELGEYFKQWLPLTGKLHPADGLRGCTFIVTDASIVLRSDHEVVDMVEGLTAEEIFPWLLERMSW